MAHSVLTMKIKVRGNNRLVTCVTFTQRRCTQYADVHSKQREIMLVGALSAKSDSAADVE